MIRTKVDEIVLILEDAIISGELAPGTVLRQDQLSHELGVSRTPVREAIRHLAALGLVSLEPKRGARVRSVPSEELAEAYRIRAELEALAAELAVNRITRSELKSLRTAERRFAEVSSQLRESRNGETATRWLTAEWFVANNEFHDVILKAAPSPLLEQMAKSVRRVFHGQFVWSDSPEIAELYRRNLLQHSAIVEAFAERDPDVRELVRGHIIDSGELLQTLLRTSPQGKPRLGTTARTPSTPRA